MARDRAAKSQITGSWMSGGDEVGASITEIDDDGVQSEATSNANRRETSIRKAQKEHEEEVRRQAEEGEGPVLVFGNERPEPPEANEPPAAPTEAALAETGRTGDTLDNDN